MKQHSSIGIIHLLFGIVFCISGFSQEIQEIEFEVIEKNIHTKSIGVEDGLPSSETYNVFQDSKGYIWISTDRGLARYDGENMKVFTVQDGLPDNVVFELFEDSDGWIWIESMNGKASYIKNDTVFLLDSLQTELKLDFHPGQYYNITEDEAGNIWFGYNRTNGLLTKYNKKDKSLLAVDVDTSGHRLNAFVKNFNNGNYLYPASAQINNTDNKSHRGIDNVFSVFSDSTEEHILIDIVDTYPGFGARVSKTPSDYYVFSKEQDIFILNRNKGGWNIRKLSFTNYISLVYADSSNKLWIGVVNDGVYELSIDNLNRLSHYLSGNTVTGLAWDLEKNLWISTLERGVLKTNNFNIITPIELPEKNNNKIVDIVTCESALQVGLQNGDWYRFYTLDSLEQKSLNADLFRFICFSDSLFLKDPTKKRAKSVNWLYHGDIEDKSLPIPTKMTNGYFGKKNSVCWLGNVIKIKPYGDSVFSEVHKLQGRVQCANEFDGLVYVGTAFGIYSYDYLTDFLRHINTTIDVVKIETYNDGLYLATKGDGIHRLRKGVLNKLSIALPNQSCNDMIVSGDTMYVATGSGVAVVNLLDNSVSLLQKKHGIPSNEVTKMAVFKDHLWVASPRTLSAIPIGSKWINTIAPNVWIESIMVNDSVSYGGQVLNSNQNNLTIIVASSAYKGDVKKFQYKFASEQKWISHTGSKLSLISLSSGDYELQIKAVNSDGISSKEPALVKFSIAPPWYASTWFLLTLFVLIIGVLYTILKIRSKATIKKIAQEEAYKRQLSEMELKALRSQMNPHFLFNAINSIQYFLLKNKGDEAKGYLSKFSLLVRNVLNHSRQEFITLEEEIKGLKLYMDIEKLRFENEFDYEINVSNELDHDFDKVPVMMIQPFVENAIWHGLMQKKSGKGKILIDFGVKEDCIVVTIQDNGIGRVEHNKNKEGKLENKRTSLGLQIINERINLFNTYRSKKMEFFVIDLYSNDNKPQGTKVILYIPFV